MSKTNKIALAIIGILILVGTFFDEQITANLSGHMTVFARFFEIFGEMPFTISTSVVTVYFAVLNLKNDSVIFKILGVVVFAVSVFLSYLAFFQVFSYLNPEGGHSSGSVSDEMKLVALVMGLIFTGVLTFVFSKKKYSVLREHRNTALFVVAMLIAVLVGVNLIKIVWGRPRIWIIEDGLAEFRPWYLPSPIADGNAYMSFISGHTANASLMVLITVLPIKFIQENRRKFFIFGITWGLLTGISRLFAGQHYLTDVTFAVLYVGIIYNLLSRKFNIEEI